MAGAYFALEFLDALMDSDEDEMNEDEDVGEMRRPMRVIRRHIRDMVDPFDVPEGVFLSRFRVTRELAWDLTEHLRPYLARRRSHGISPARQVCVALNFFATGSIQASVGDNFLCAVSQPVVSRCIQNVALGINELLLREWVKFPTTPEERRLAKAKFSRAPQPFEGALGAIDCTHVAILAPREHEEAYLNHHSYHSMNVQMVCDPDRRILQVCARYGGRTHDAFIWSASPVRANMRENYENGERDTYLIGDSGYPLEPWMMTPIPDAPLNTPEYRYTSYHCKARSIIERCFGLLKTVWICLSKKRLLWYNPVAAGRITNACAVLHNMRLHYRVEDIEIEERVPALNAEDVAGDEEAPPAVLPDAATLRIAREIRRDFIARNFA